METYCKVTLAIQLKFAITYLYAQSPRKKLLGWRFSEQLATVFWFCFEFPLCQLQYTKIDAVTASSLGPNLSLVLPASLSRSLELRQLVMTIDLTDCG